MVRNIGYVELVLSALFLLMCLLIGQVKYALPQTPIVLTFCAVSVGAIYHIGKKKISVGDRGFWIGVTALLVLALLVEVYVVSTLPFEWATDPRLCKVQAEYMLNTWQMSPEVEGYFSMYPNNINMLIILGALYRLLGDYDYVVYVFLVLVNLSSLFACLTVRNLTKSNVASLITLLLLQVFCIFTTRTYMPYTSNLALLFPILLFYVYTSQLSTRKKAFLIPLIAALGWQAKVTALIAFVAIIMIEGYRYLRNRKQYSKNVIGTAVVSAAVFFSVMACVKALCWDGFGYKIDDNKVKGYTYFVYLGQNTQSGGQWDLEYVHNSEYSAPSTERDAYYRSVIKRDITERGLVGNVKFYIAKTAICWGCTFQDYVKFNNNDAKWVFTLRHCIWFLIMACAMLSVFICRNRYNMAMMLTLTGVMLYLFLSEGSFTYVIMFSPIVFAMAGVTIAKLFVCIKSQS